MSSIRLYGDTSGYVELKAPNVAGDNVVTLPSAGFGKVLQVVSASTTTEVRNATNNWVDTTLTATITPSSTASRIVVMVNQFFYWTGDTRGAGLRVLRNSTLIHDPVSGGGVEAPYDWYLNSNINFYTRGSIILTDSPSTTSAVTYKTQGRRGGNNIGTAVFQGADNVPATSYITLFEVAE